MEGARNTVHAKLMRPAANRSRLEATIRDVVRLIALPIALVFCALLFAIDAICRIPTHKWSRPKR